MAMMNGSDLNTFIELELGVEIIFLVIGIFKGQAAFELALRVEILGLFLK